MEEAIYTVYVDDDDQGIEKISFVESPAILVDFVALRKQGRKTIVMQKDQQMVYGPAIIPGQLIPRINAAGDEWTPGLPDSFYIKYDAKTIEQIRDKFSENANFSTALNIEHRQEAVPGVIVEQWIVSDGEDKARNLGFDLPPGTWMLGVRIKDKSFWNDKIKTQELKGFSIEGLFTLKKDSDMEKEEKTPAPMAQAEISNKIIHEVEPKTKTILTMFNQNIKKLAQMLTASEKPEKQNLKIKQGLHVLETDEGKYYIVVAKNRQATLINEETGESKTPEDGNYMTAEGYYLTIEGGTVVAIMAEPASEESTEPAAESTSEESTESAAESASEATMEQMDALRIDENGRLVPPEGYAIESNEDGTVRVVKQSVLTTSRIERLADVMLKQAEANQKREEEITRTVKELSDRVQKISQTLQNVGFAQFADFSSQEAQSASTAEVDLEQMLKEIEVEKAKKRKNAK